MTAAGRGRALHSDDPRRLGPYALSARLGSGGMGVVFLAQTDDGGEAAVKVVHQHLVGDPDFRIRFAREIAVARSVDAPWTARVLAADPHGERPWLATEFVDGPALDEQVARFGGLPRSALELLGRRLAEALAALHAGGVVHRDLKPSNVLLAADGPRLIDFGIARSVDATKITHTGLVMGTPAYMAPEQADGEESGAPADVFSLASVLYFAATGDAPFGTAAHPAATLLRILQRTPDTSALPAPLDAWLPRCFARDPADRPSAAQLATDWALATPRVDLTKRLPAPTLVTPPEPAAEPAGMARSAPLLRIANLVLALLVGVALAASLLWVPTTTATATEPAATSPDGAFPQATKVADVAMDRQVFDMVVSPDGRTLLVAGPGGLQFVDVASRTPSSIVSIASDVNAAVFSADGRQLFLAGRGISVLDVGSRTITPPIGDTRSEIRSIDPAPDGTTAYVSYTDRDDVAVVDLASGRELAAIFVGMSGADLLTAGRDRLLVKGNAGSGLVVVDPVKRAIVGRLNGRVSDVGITEGDRKAFALVDQTVQRVDLTTGKTDGFTFPVLTKDAYKLHITPTGDAMVMHTLVSPMIHITDGKGVPRQDIDAGADVQSVALSPDGRAMYAATREDRSTLQVYDTSALAR